MRRRRRRRASVSAAVRETGAELFGGGHLYLLKEVSRLRQAEPRRRVISEVVIEARRDQGAAPGCGAAPLVCAVGRQTLQALRDGRGRPGGVGWRGTGKNQARAGPFDVELVGGRGLAGGLADRLGQGSRRFLVLARLTQRFDHANQGGGGGSGLRRRRRLPLAPQP